MSSKILSGPESKGWQPNANSSQGKKQDPSNLIGQEFRGLPNRGLITLVITLCGFGLMAVFSASAPEALQSMQDSTAFLRRQAIACAIGFFCMFTLSKYDYRKLKKFAWPLTFMALVLLGITLVPGLSRATMGATRWIQIGPIQFQPCELAKVAAIILMASGVSKYFWWHRNVFIRIIMVMLMAGIVVKQPDLGSAMMLLGTLLSMLYVSGTNSFLILGAMGVGGALAWKHVQHTPYQIKRIETWLNPYLHP
ncbi:MAG: FtsW/RodA/SpoVE family cell cycle protein, partial [Candidatus Obscuribacterales bacterium]|nr:FtsW/RodA/SpoVE family cell cycle protein [Candidatus Obscuribacterales bacterium]